MELRSSMRLCNAETPLTVQPDRANKPIGKARSTTYSGVRRVRDVKCGHTPTSFSSQPRSRSAQPWQYSMCLPTMNLQHPPQTNDDTHHIHENLISVAYPKQSNSTDIDFHDTGPYRSGYLSTSNSHLSMVCPLPLGKAASTLSGVDSGVAGASSVHITPRSPKCCHHHVAMDSTGNISTIPMTSSTHQSSNNSSTTTSPKNGDTVQGLCYPYISNTHSCSSMHHKANISISSVTTNDLCNNNNNNISGGVFNNSVNRPQSPVPCMTPNSNKTVTNMWGSYNRGVPPHNFGSSSSNQRNQWPTNSGNTKCPLPSQQQQQQPRCESLNSQSERKSDMLSSSIVTRSGSTNNKTGQQSCGRLPSDTNAQGQSGQQENGNGSLARVQLDQGSGACYTEICNARYTRQQLIGKGSNKQVYKAYDEEEGVEVAWNEIEFCMFPDQVRVENEVNLLKTLDHPSIIRCLGWWTDTGRRCIVFITELMMSGTLQDFIDDHKSHDINRTQSLPNKVILKYTKQILLGIAYLHDQGIIHRDLKCGNIFINGHKGEVKIGDLGLSIASRNASSIIGTPEFMAPEMYEEHYTNKIDIWSMGMCVYQLATGCRPYSECDNIGQIFKKVNSRVLPQYLEPPAPTELDYRIERESPFSAWMELESTGINDEVDSDPLQDNDPSSRDDVSDIWDKGGQISNVKQSRRNNSHLSLKDNRGMGSTTSTTNHQNNNGSTADIVIDEDIRQLIVKCLAFDPADRPTALDLLEMDIFEQVPPFHHKYQQQNLAHNCTLGHVIPQDMKLEECVEVNNHTSQIRSHMKIDRPVIQFSGTDNLTIDSGVTDSRRLSPLLSRSGDAYDTTGRDSVKQMPAHHSAVRHNSNLTPWPQQKSLSLGQQTEVIKWLRGTPECVRHSILNYISSGNCEWLTEAQAVSILCSQCPREEPGQEELPPTVSSIQSNVQSNVVCPNMRQSKDRPQANEANGNSDGNHSAPLSNLIHQNNNNQNVCWGEQGLRSGNPSPPYDSTSLWFTSHDSNESSLLPCHPNNPRQHLGSTVVPPAGDNLTHTFNLNPMDSTSINVLKSTNTEEWLLDVYGPEDDPTQSIHRQAQAVDYDESTSTDAIGAMYLQEDKYNTMSKPSIPSIVMPVQQQTSVPISLHSDNEMNLRGSFWGPDEKACRRSERVSKAEPTLAELLSCSSPQPPFMSSCSVGMRSEVPQQILRVGDDSSSDLTRCINSNDNTYSITPILTPRGTHAPQLVGSNNADTDHDEESRRQSKAQESEMKLLAKLSIIMDMDDNGI